MKRVGRRANIAMVLALVSTSAVAVFLLGKGVGQPQDVGALNYQVDRTALRNSLLLAATEWPSMKPEDIAALTRLPPLGEREHFSEWVRGTVGNPWLPEGFQNVPYLAEWGFVYVKENQGWRVRVRQVQEPAYVGASFMTKSIVMAVEPPAGGISVWKTQQAMESLLGEFLSLAKPLWAAKDQASPVFRALAGGYFLARWPVGATSKPVQIYAWTDGKIILIALYEDVKYGTGPTPSPQTSQTPPPPEEKGEIHKELTPEELEREAN